MWIPNPKDWHKSHTDLSKYFIEKLKQKVDTTEIISNKHRTSCALTLIAEIINVAENALKREKSISRLISLLRESTDKDLSFSIVNDFIVKEYFSDISKFYEDLNKNNFYEAEKNTRSFILKNKIFFNRLSKEYHKKIEAELKKVDFMSNQFDRESNKIDKIIEVLIPTLLFMGYSATTIDEISYKCVRKDKGNESPFKIFKFFNFKNSEFLILLKFKKNTESTKGIFNYLKEASKEHKIVSFEEIKEHTSYIKDFEVKEDDELLEIYDSTIDPHNLIRNIYDRSLKRHVASEERLDLSFFTYFFDQAYWRFKKNNGSKAHGFTSSKNDLDPINVKNRKSTLRETLYISTYEFKNKYTKNDKLPYIEDLSQAIYFYNLALGSKSIENSLFLLWTSLETLLPYRIFKNDIENVQHFVSSSLGFGSILRDTGSLIIRFNESKIVNPLILQKVEPSPSTKSISLLNLQYWVEFLSIDHKADSISDPFQYFKESSNLLCKEFTTLNTIYSQSTPNVEDLLKRIIKSEMSIKYQLDRIYFHRNQVVHSGKFLTEYSNLWSNLEWYLGKLLSYIYMNYYQNSGKLSDSVENLFIQLESDSQQIKILLENNKNKSIRDIRSSLSILLKHSWQSF
jgi:hypothetical protein